MMLRKLFFPAGIIAAVLIAAQTEDDALRFMATVAGAGCVSFTVTTLVLEKERTRRSQQAIAEAYLEFLRSADRPPQKLRKPPRPSACVGCCHYHGKAYGGTPLICAMHPYGVETETCPDWEGNLHTADKQRSMGDR